MKKRLSYFVKKYSLFFIIFSIQGVFAQEKYANFQADFENKINSQKEYFEKAINNSDEITALYAYHSVVLFELNTEIERISKKKIDSLLLIYQKKYFEKIKGKWKLKQLKTDLFSYEYIKITDSEILFYDKIDSDLPSRVEKIKFPEYDYDISISNVVFQNNEIWDFSISTEKEEERLYPKIKRTSDGIYHLLVDERSYIRNPIEREKALEEDIYTYYLRF